MHTTSEATNGGRTETTAGGREGAEIPVSNHPNGAGRVPAAGVALIKQLLIEGRNSPYINGALIQAGHLQPGDKLSRQAIHYYRQQIDVQAAIAEVSKAASQEGYANRYRRILLMDTAIEDVVARLYPDLERLTKL